MSVLSYQVLDCPRLMETLLSEFLPTSWTAPSPSPPHSAYGFPLVGAMKLLRVVATSGRHACARLVCSEALLVIVFISMYSIYFGKTRLYFPVELFWSDGASFSSAERWTCWAATGEVRGPQDHHWGLQAVGCSSWIWTGLQTVHVSKLWQTGRHMQTES